MSLDADIRTIWAAFDRERHGQMVGLNALVSASGLPINRFQAALIALEQRGCVRLKLDFVFAAHGAEDTCLRCGCPLLGWRDRPVGAGSDVGPESRSRLESGVYHRRSVGLEDLSPGERLALNSGRRR